VLLTQLVDVLRHVARHSALDGAAVDVVHRHVAVERLPLDQHAPVTISQSITSQTQNMQA